MHFCRNIKRERKAREEKTPSEMGRRGKERGERGLDLQSLTK
jgi:hypothetical protein